MDDPDVALMLEFQKGDNKAFSALMERYQKPVMNVVYRYLQDYNAAEDLAQETFLRVYQQRNAYKPTAKFSTWLFQICVNLCLNERRFRSYRNHESLNVTYPGDDKPMVDVADQRALSGEQKMIESERAALVRKAIAELPEKERMMILLAKWEHMDYEAIAEVMNCSVLAVKSRIFRAKQILKNKLKPYFLPGEEERQVPAKGRVIV